MKKLSLALAIAATFTATAFAKEVTVSGEGKCLKCALKKSDTCQNVVEVKKGDKTTTYYLVGDVSKGFHGNLCKVGKEDKVKVTFTGMCEKKDDKLEVTVAKIEKAK